MPSKYGVNVELYNGSLNPYEINNRRPIAIVGDDSTRSTIAARSQ